MLTNLTQSDAGNYSCRGMRKSGPQSQWVYIHGELHCNIKKPSTGVNKPPPKENAPWKEIVENGFPIVGSTEPYAFLLDSSGEIQNGNDFVDNIQLTEGCEDSPEDCADRLGSSTAVIGIGTMCSIFFIAYTSAHVLTHVLTQVAHINCLCISTHLHTRRYARHAPTPTLPSHLLYSAALSYSLESSLRKILRRQRRVFRVQLPDRNCVPQTNSAERLPMDNISPEQDKVSIISAVSRNPTAFQEVIYLDRTPNVGDLVYVPHSTVFEQHCASPAQPLFLPLATSSHTPAVS
ncbi:hypothetical protein ACTXT7_012443 [Hymenolepis weldensis]